MVRADQGVLTKLPGIATFSSLVSLGVVHDQQRALYEAAAHRARVGRARMAAAACGQGEHVPASMCRASEVAGWGCQRRRRTATPRAASARAGARAARWRAPGRASEALGLLKGSALPLPVLLPAPRSRVAFVARIGKKPGNAGAARSRYSLVAVGLPHHHGVGVGGLAGGDHGGLVEDGGDGGDSGHFVLFVRLCRN